MKLSLGRLPAYVINLDRSRDRWIRFARDFRSFFPNQALRRISGVDGREYLDPGDTANHGWKADVLKRLRREGVVSKRDKNLLDPVRTALCLSHQRALRTFLDEMEKSHSGDDGNPASPEPWGLIFEDDARPGEALASHTDDRIEVCVPDDSEALFLHDRVWKRGASPRHHSPEAESWRVVRGGIGLEAYAVNRSGARKMLDAFRPVLEECDIQLMTFMEGFADLEQKAMIHQDLAADGHVAFPEIRAYAPVRPLFQTDHWLPSVKFETMDEARPSNSV